MTAYISPVKVGRISYANVAPVYYGLNNGDKPAWMHMISAPPSDLNALLASENLDISPVSSAAYARNQDKWLLLPDLSISCFGNVMSVLLVSKYPFKDLGGRKVVLTRESATAAALTRYLFASENVRPCIETAKVRQAEDLDKNTDAALVIGDAALKENWADKFNYVWDLGQMWKHKTGLPFVFALWAVRKSFARQNPETVCAVLDHFHHSKKSGLNHIENILPSASKTLGITHDLCRKYYQHLHYDLTLRQINGARRFFDGLYQTNIISRPVNLSFFQTHVREYAA